MFKYQLELGHNDEAYSAMVSNPDPSRYKTINVQIPVKFIGRKTFIWVLDDDSACHAQPVYKYM